MKISSRQSCFAFTRIELVFTLCTIALVGAVLLISFRSVRNQRDSKRCIGNLKEINLAWVLWMDENDANAPPWQTPVNNKGTFGFEPASLRGESWFQFAVLSNQLGSPKFLADPSDRSARVAKTWDANSQSGLAAPQFRDNAISYGIGLDLGLAGPRPLDMQLASKQVSLLDRHLQGSVGTGYCSTALIASTFKKPFEIGWSSEIHGGGLGSVALIDGSVEQMSAPAMKAILPVNTDPLRRLEVHFLFPRRSAPRNKTW